MQSVWSRIAQTRGTCGCPQCLQSVQGVSRRAAASATRRARFTTSSTLWYSGIFAAAATFDAGAKIQRREQWDQAIAEVKQELGQSADKAGRQTEKTQAEVRNVRGVPKSELDVLLEETADLFLEVEPHKRRPHWPTNTGPPLAVNHLPPDSIYATEHRKVKAEVRRWTPKKLETVMLSVDGVQLRILCALQEAGDPNWRDQASAAVPVEYRDKMLLSEAELNAAIDGKRTDLRRLWSIDSALPEWRRSAADMALSSYNQDDEGSFHITARELNQSLQDLFKQHTNQAISTPSLLAKIAYNISLSSAPPNVHTYNTLLLGFGRAGQPTLVYNVIRSLRETHVRPNEVTNCTILDHYTAMHDAKHFVRWIELMRGKHGGLALARKDIKITGAGASRLTRFKWKEDEHERVVQLPYPTPNVFGAIIRGVLRFSGFDTALNICEGMGQEGWGICMGGLTPLLLDCADRADWTSGLAVWRQIQALKGRSVTRQGRRIVAVENVPVWSYAAMLRLCLACDQKEPFRDIWRQTLRTHGHLKTGQLTKMIEAQKACASEQPNLQSGEPELGGMEAGSDIVRRDDSVDVIADDINETAAIQDDWSDRPAEPANNPASASPAGQVLRDLRGVAEDKQRGQDVAFPGGMGVDSAKPTSRRGPSAAAAVMGRDQATQHEEAIMLREQLDGCLPPNQELEEYEMCERPMTMHG
ncbi:hypothetical protein LTR36_004330 [Oleoguttula mirabilis]|uniref:Uncharacterized protein n=1 Tax=Oleoguttula mirabilis TaxID=1507867 RepID=A0AAV9JGU0_9PEZI|nr:hypothetical protein LTR36_004330 [Oleoguttula mirabilis]